jgi:hypothetical protein
MARRTRGLRFDELIGQPINAGAAAFTRRHYERVAALLAKQYQRVACDSDTERAQHLVSMLDVIRDDFITLFERDNQWFSEARFRDAIVEATQEVGDET